MAKQRQTNVNINYVVNDKAIDRSNKLLLQANAHTDKLNQSAKKAGETIKKAGDDGSKSWASFSNVIKTVSFALVINEVGQFIKKMISVTGEFQKFEAVLTNTLGSNSKARLALSEIVKFAAKTPFSVNELTASFVKLANQGFVPATKEMKKLGDLAASTGKQFDQLVEAIIDAQTGEFERLKEFGIRATKQGDQVTFAFKGVKTQVDFTNESIRNYILALGEAEGVSGAMASISATLAGEISNMGDNFTQLLNNLGNYNKGPIGEFFRLFNAGLTKLNEMIATANLQAGDLAEIPLARFRKSFDEAAKSVKDNKGFEKMNQLFIDLTEAINSVNEDIATNTSLIQVMNSEGENESETYKKLVSDLEIYKAELIGYKEIRQDITKAVKDSAEAEKAAAAASRNGLMDRRKEKVDDGFFSLKLKEGASEDIGDQIKVAIDNIPEAQKSVEITPTTNADKLAEFWEENWRGYLQQGIEDTNNFLLANEQAEIDSLQRRVNEIRNFYDEQQLLAGDNDRYKAELRIKEEREIAAVNRKIAQKEWQLKKNSIILNIAGGIARAFLDYQWPYALIPAAAVAAQGALQLSAVEKARPGFAEGVIDLKGPGSTTSDSIDARLSRGESIMTADETQSSMNILKAIRARKLNDRVMKEIVSGKSGGASVVNAFDDSRVVGELKALRESQPDIVEQAGIVYKVYKKGSNFRQKVRAKSMNA